MDLFTIERKIQDAMKEYWKAAQEMVREQDDQSLIDLILSNRSNWSGGIGAKNFCEQTVRECAAEELKKRSLLWNVLEVPNYE